MLVRACLKHALCTGGHRAGGSTRVGTPARHAYSRGSWERSAVLLAQCLGLFAAQNCPNLAESSVLAYKRERRARPSGFPQLPAPCPLSPGTHSSLPTTLHSLQGKKGRKPPQQAGCRAIPHSSEDCCQANTQMIFLGIFIFRRCFFNA